MLDGDDNNHNHNIHIDNIIILFMCSAFLGSTSWCGVVCRAGAFVHLVVHCNWLV